MIEKMQHTANKVINNLVKELGYKIKSPFFIIGTGRCGSSLLVKILNSHPELIGYSEEANDLWHPKSYPFSKKTIETPAMIENPYEFTKISIKNWPYKHEKTIKRKLIGYNFFKGKNKRLFIKSAMISFMVPRLHLIFPDAKFIHIYRTGPAVVESFFKKEWKKYSKYFDSKQDYRYHCANYWNSCLIEIETQKNNIMEVLYEFSYESLCE